MKMTDPQQRMRERLHNVYGETASDILPRVHKLLDEYRGQIPPDEHKWDQSDVLLISYADSIVRSDVPPLQTLQAFLSQHVGSRITMLHLLPFFPYSSDDGFAVQDFRQVRDDLGNWNDIEVLAEDYRLGFDAVINHVSASSTYMNRYLAGEEPFEDFFIELDPETDTSSVLRTRDEPLLHKYETGEGPKWLWTTFSRDQVDLDFSNPDVLLEVLDVLLFFARRGASILRLDAIPYLWKELGTSCAHLPETHELIKFFRDAFDDVAPHVLLLAECNVPQEKNFSYLGDGGDEAQIVYNFTLPPLIVFALDRGDASHLTEWAHTVPDPGPRATYLNITATHDGIGMRPTEGLLTEDERQRLIDLAFERDGDVTGKRNSDGSISPYELNISYFDAINDPHSDEPLDVQVKRFMLSQAIAMGFQGIPAVYIHSLLGSRNYLEGVEQTGRARSINREQLELNELERALETPQNLLGRVLSAYRRMLKIRQNEPAFHPDADQTILDCGPDLFALKRNNQDSNDVVYALHNVTGEPATITRSKLPETALSDLLTGETHENDEITLSPYQVMWLKA